MDFGALSLTPIYARMEVGVLRVVVNVVIYIHR